jgi:uncharacterized protein involved in outer membrane biogenesis
MKKLLVILGIILIAFIVLAVIKDAILGSVISAVASNVTGAPVHIDAFALGIFKQSVKIQGLRMGNPPGFSNAQLIDLPKVEVACDLFALLKGRLHLPLVEVDLKEITLEKNKEGKLNVDSLKVVQDAKAPAKEGAKTKAAAKALPMQIDVLNISMGKIVMKDYGQGREPAMQVFDINLKKSYKNITSAQQLAALLLSEPMKQAGIKGAAIYGAAMLTGVGIIPVAVVSAFGGKDSIQQQLDANVSKVYGVALAVLKRIGKVSKEDNQAYTILAEVNGVSVSVKLKESSAQSAQVTISARKFMLPKPEVANGVLYQIQEELKK